MSVINTKWLRDITGEYPLAIAGPCSAETEEQVLTIAKALKKDHRVQGFRAGIWKPRTRPGNFEGVGAIGLGWMQNVKKETGLLLATEVANKHHVELALEYDVDILWIGARSTVSPFIVQEIADALKGTDKIVLVKNPVSPDLELWAGALERLDKVGIKKLGAIHRGFTSYYKSKYRNQPMWQLPIDINEQFPDVPMILDPSHIAGNRDYILELSQTSFDLNFDGLLIETHHTPDKAWSDAAQQITPERLKEVLDTLMIRDDEFKEEVEELAQLREDIDHINLELIHLLAERMKKSVQIGKIKRDNNVSILQSDRWKQILDNISVQAEKAGLPKEFIIKIFKTIHESSINYQEQQ